MSLRVYLPTTLAALAELAESGRLAPGGDAVAATDDSEDAEYAALVTAAGSSAALVAGLPDDDLGWYATQELDSLL